MRGTAVGQVFSAIHIEYCAVEKVFSRQKNHSPPDIFRCPIALQWQALGDTGPAFVSTARLLEDRAGRDRIGADSRGQAACHNPGEHQHAGLGNAVMGELVPGLQGAVINDIDDHAASRILGEHEASRSLTAQEWPGEVYRHHPLPFFIGDIEKICLIEHPGAVHKDVQPPKLCFDGRKHGSHILGIGLVSLNGQGSHAVALDLADCVLRRVFGAVVVDDDMHAFGCERQGNGFADPVGGAGDKGDVVDQRLQHRSTVLYRLQIKDNNTECFVIQEMRNQTLTKRQWSIFIQIQYNHSRLLLLFTLKEFWRVSACDKIILPVLPTGV